MPFVIPDYQMPQQQQNYSGLAKMSCRIWVELSASDAVAPGTMLSNPTLQAWQPRFPPSSQRYCYRWFHYLAQTKDCYYVISRQISRQVLHSLEKRSRQVSWSSYFPLFSWKHIAESYPRHVEIVENVLGALTERSAPTAHLRSTWYNNNAKFNNSNQCSSQHDQASA